MFIVGLRTDKIVKKINISFVRKIWKCKYRRVQTCEAIFECSSCAPDLYEDGAHGGWFGWGTALQAARSLKFFIDIIHPAAPCPWVDSASNRNEYQEYLLGGEGSWYALLTNLLPSCANCLIIWEPQPPGTLRVCPSLYKDCFTFTCVYENYSKRSSLLKCFRLEVNIFITCVL